MCNAINIENRGLAKAKPTKILMVTMLIDFVASRFIPNDKKCYQLHINLVPHSLWLLPWVKPKFN